MGVTCSTHDVRNAYTIFIRKFLLKGPHGRPRHELEDNVKMDDNGIGVRIWTKFIWPRLAPSVGLL
jgi:hypothetical protein